jgi:predicted GTPase
LTYHPGEVNVRRADVIVVNKVDSAAPGDVDRVIEDVRTVNTHAVIVQAESPVTLDPGPPLAGKRVLVVEDGPTLTHGGMAFGAGTVAARQAGAVIVEPRPYAVGSIAAMFERYPGIGAVLPAMGYGDAQLRELAETIDRVDCEVVVTGTPFDLGRLITTRHPIRHARYELREVGRPDLHELVAPIERLAHGELTTMTG